MTNRFYNFVKTDTDAELYITGDIASDDMAEFYEFFDENCTCPNSFKQSLDELDGSPLTVYIDSYGGDVIAASAIYTMLREYKGQVTVKIDSIAASAASVIAMAGDTVLMSRTAQLMIHDPSTEVWGNITEIKQGLDALKSIKEGIINAYERKSNLPREKIAKLMTDETWLDFNTALEYGFVDGELGGEKPIIDPAVLDSIKASKMRVYNSLHKPQREIPSVSDTIYAIEHPAVGIIETATASGLQGRGLAKSDFAEAIFDNATDDTDALQAEYEYLKLKNNLGLDFVVEGKK